jgi:hypothetical protein
MEATVLAGIAGLIGIVIGRLWDTRSESARWRRDRRVQSYQDVASAFYTFREALRLLGELEPGTPEFDRQRERTAEVSADWNRSLASVWLQGSELAAAAALELDHALVVLLRRAITGVIDWQAWPEARESAQQAFDDFVDAVRTDLAMPKLAVLRAGAAARSAQPPAASG